MLKLRHVVAPLVLFACTVSAAAQTGNTTPALGRPALPDYDPAMWREFTSPEGRFSVLLPGAPTKKVTQSDTPVGKIDSHSHWLRTSNQSPQYGVSHFDLPDGVVVEDAAAMFDDARDEGMSAVKGKLLEQREDSSVGHPGRLYKVEAGDGDVMRIKTFLVKNRLYTLYFITPAGSEPAAAKHRDDAAAKFFDSFRLLSEQELAAFEGEVDRLLKSLRAKGETVLSSVAPCATPDCAASRQAPAGEARVHNSKVISKPAPSYPAVAKAARAQGTVVVQIVLDEQGKVMAAQAVSGHPLLRAAAVSAARAAVFTPTLLDGKPVKIVGTLNYSFNLQ